MPLTIPEIKEILKKKPTANNSTLQDAVEHEERIALHTEPLMDRFTTSHAINQFLAWVRGILPADKYYMYLSLLRFPLPTVALTGRIFKSLAKIFDGRNPVYQAEFKSAADAQDFKHFRNKELKAMEIWRTEGMYRMRSAINSLVVVDLPTEQRGSRPAPYFYFIDVDQVIEFKPDGYGLEWILFEMPGDQVAAYCDGFYRVFSRNDGSRDLNFEEYIESAHDLGECPVRWFWTEPLSRKNLAIKKSPLTDYLGRLDSLLLFDGGNEHLNTFGRWPIFTAVSKDCDFRDDETGIYCDDGFLRNDDDRYLWHYAGGENQLKQCPKCSVTRFNGPGSYIEYEPPGPANENTVLKDPVSIVSIDRTSLDYNNEDLERREAYIFNAVTGFKAMPSGSQAMNSDQIFALLESQEAALEGPQRNMELIIKWTDKIVAKLRYSSFVSCSLSLGTEHFILGASEVMKLHETAKKSFSNMSVLDQLEDLYFATEYRNNPEELARQAFIANLDPFRHRSFAEVSAMKMANQIHYSDFMIKANFSSLLLRFEREFFPITEFDDNIPLYQQIKVVRDMMMEYVKEMEPEQLPAPIDNT